MGDDGLASDESLTSSRHLITEMEFLTRRTPTRNEPETIGSAWGPLLRAFPEAIIRVS